MHALQKLLFLLGRFCLSFIFIVSGIEKIFNWGAAEEAVLDQFCQWITFSLQSDWLQSFLDALITWIPLLLVVYVGLELLGSILILLGIKIRLGSFFLIMALIPATLLFHNFWMLEEPAAQVQMAMFLKNVSILGALLILLVVGHPFKHLPGKKKARHLEE